MSNNETETTFDAKKHRDEIAQKKAERLTNPITKGTTHGGDKIANEPLPQYPFKSQVKKAGKPSPTVVVDEP
jgi:hypothetical protein